MKLKFIFSFATLCFANLAFASTTPPKPEICPSTAALQTANFTHVETESNGDWVAISSDNYATKEEWGFVVGVGKATNENDALKKAHDALNTLNYLKGPELAEIFDFWYCEYKTNYGYAFTLTPIDDNDLIKFYKAHH